MEYSVNMKASWPPNWVMQNCRHDRVFSELCLADSKSPARQIIPQTLACPHTVAFSAVFAFLTDCHTVQCHRNMRTHVGIFKYVTRQGATLGAPCLVSRSFRSFTGRHQTLATTSSSSPSIYLAFTTGRISRMGLPGDRSP